MGLSGPVTGFRLLSSKYIIIFVDTIYICLRKQKKLELCMEGNNTIIYSVSVTKRGL
jgi:hypothetical protein